ncbi:hypothetical protein [Pseudomonas germanica]|uniref:hypothetical protein n=1 Tax=Pseudomonas germanica TaxID=2815720 RepID=UPI002A4E29AD|nr:hypothetical protein [Pseudomonas germanica]WPN73670.1 hypothetical protein QMK46_23295 [Pseudomonas germanica]
MNYPITTNYRGWTILEHDPANSGDRFQIVYSGGQTGGLFKSLADVQQSIDFQIANSKGKRG